MPHPGQCVLVDDICNFRGMLQCIHNIHSTINILCTIVVICTDCRHTYRCTIVSELSLLHVCLPPANCTGGKEWNTCGTACPLTCDNYETDIACTRQCVQDCFCPEGKVDLNGVCVEPSICSGGFGICLIFFRYAYLLTFLY